MKANAATFFPVLLFALPSFSRMKFYFLVWIFWKDTHSVGEDEASMTKLQMFEQAVELTTIDRAPGTVQILSRLSLLPRVVVVNKLVKNPLLFAIFFVPVSFLGWCSHVIRGSCVLSCQRRTKRK